MFSRWPELSNLTLRKFWGVDSGTLPQFLHNHWKSHMDFAKPQENPHSITSAVTSIKPCVRPYQLGRA